MDGDTRSSFDYAARVTEQASSSFYLATQHFDDSVRPYLRALYAFCRLTDDAVDEAGNYSQARAALRHFQTVFLRRAAPPDESVWPALYATIDRFAIPQRYFQELLYGLQTDIGPVRLRTQAELVRYCYRVAGTVGLMCAKVLGVSDRVGMAGAKQLGIAMQLTNIARDIGEDFSRDRIYLPLSWRRQNGLTEDMIAAQSISSEYHATMQRLAELAEGYYRAAERSYGSVPWQHRLPVLTVAKLYHRLLRKLQASGFAVYGRRIRLSQAEKIHIARTIRRPNPVKPLT